MIRCAGWMIVFYGAAHTLLALFMLDAIRYAGDWYSGALWHDDLANMGPANSALWLSIDSFGPPLVLVGVIVLWLNQRGITPPSFIAWSLLAWNAIDAPILLFTPWPIILCAAVLLLVGTMKARGTLQPIAAVD
jgi:hypothetical protein